MEAKSQRAHGRDGALFPLNAAIDALVLARDEVNMKPAKDVFGSASVLLTIIRDSVFKKVDYVELGLACAGVCKALHQGMNGRRVDQSSQSVLKAIEQLATTVAEIQRHIVQRGKLNAISRRFYAKDDGEAITAWRLDLDVIRRTFGTELGVITAVNAANTCHGAPNTHTPSDIHLNVVDPQPIVPGLGNENEVIGNGVPSTIHHNALGGHKDTYGQNGATHASAPGIPLPKARPGTVSDIRRDVVKTRTIVSEVQRDVLDIQQILRTRQGNGRQNRTVQDGILGEIPPPPQRAIFGRDELVEGIVGFADLLKPIALIGTGGIGKTSIALTVLHDDRIKRRFGDHRRFIRCDQFPASLVHFLRRLSKAIGAGTENPEDLASLRPFLSSKEILIVLDNAESILDPQVPDSREIYNAIEELSQLSNICLCLTSRISTVPPDCETIEIPTLPMEAARDVFYRIYKQGKQSDLVDDVLVQLDFHPLSVTLLATVAHHNKWDTTRLTREWEKRRTGVLETKHKTSLATTIELSLASPLFQGLGPDSRELLGVIAFYPQGVDENNLDRFFPSTSNAADMFDNFCILSLTYRSEGFVKMLAPLRDYLSPKDPLSSPLLCMTRDCYFGQLSLIIHPDKPEFGETQWILSEDVNVEHLLDVLTSINPNSSVWDSCTRFMHYLCWYKPRLVVLGPKIEGLPDDHPSKPQSLLYLSRLFASIGNYVECKRLRTHTLNLWRDRGDLKSVALALTLLSDVYRKTNLREEGIQLAKEALEIYEHLDDTTGQAECLIVLARTLHHNGQLDAAEETASRAITLFPENQFLACKYHSILGDIYCSKGNREKTVEHLETALEIASAHDWHKEAFGIHHTLATLFSEEGMFDDANVHVELAKSHVVNNPRISALAVELQAFVWSLQGRLEEAEFEFSRAVNALEKVGAVADAETCRKMLSLVRVEMNKPVPPGES